MKTKTDDLRKQVAQTLKKISKLQCLKDLGNTQQNIVSFIERVEDRSFCVAVVGTVSSGKSTFLNALLGQDLLTHGSQETTATITRLNNTDVNDRRYGTCMVHYTNGTTQEFADTRELSRVSAIQHHQSTEQNKSFNASRDVAAVDLYPHFVDADMPVVFVDTPGLNGTADYHREKTIEQIRSAHACIYLLPVRGLSQFDVEFVRDLCRYQKDFIFVQNFADSLKAEGEGESLDQKIQEQTAILYKEVFSQQKDVQYHVCVISARNALIAKDHSFTRVYETDAEELTEKARTELYEKSNFQSVLDKIQRLVSENQKGIRQLRSTIAAAVLELGREYTFLCEMQLAEREEFESSIAGKSIRDLKEMEERLHQMEWRNLEDLRNFWNSETNENKARQQKLIKAEILDIEQRIQNSIEGCDTLDKIDNYCEQNILQKELNPCVEQVENKLIAEFQESFEASMGLAITRIVEYTGWKGIQKKALPNLTVNVEKRMIDDMSDQDGIRRQSERTERAAEQIKRVQHDLISNQNIVQQSQQKLAEVEQQKTAANEKYSTEVQKKGTEPEVEVHYETRYETRGGLFGKIIDCFAGKKSYSVRCEDTSKRDAWRKEKNKLDNTHRETINRLDDQIRDYENKLKNLPRMIKACEDELKRVREQYEQLSRTVQKMREEAEVKRTQAMQEYIHATQNALKSALRRYLYDVDNSLEIVWIDAFRKAAEQENENGWKYIHDMYQNSMKHRLAELKQRITENGEKRMVAYPDVDKFEQLLKELKEVIA